MIIDAHTHIGDTDVLQGTSEQLIASMSEARIQHGVVIAGLLNGYNTSRVLADFEQNNRFGQLSVIGSIHPEPRAFTVPELEYFESQIKNPRVKGMKFFLGYEEFYPTDPRIRPVLEMLARAEKPAFFHTGDCYTRAGVAKMKYAHPFHIDDLAAELPKLTIVMAHMGNPWITDAKAVCYSKPNVHTDVSGYVLNAFSPRDEVRFQRDLREMIDYAGIDKVMFGTDWPIANQQNYAEVCARALDAWNVPIEAQELFFAGTAKRLFRL